MLNIVETVYELHRPLVTFSFSLIRLTRVECRINFYELFIHIIAKYYADKNSACAKHYFHCVSHWFTDTDCCFGNSIPKVMVLDSKVYT